MEQPVIITVSSCRVSKYRDYQLAATPATYYYLIPNILEAETSRALYKFKAYITDTSGTTSLTFLTPAADKITGHSCKELVEKYKPANLKKIPPEVLATEGKTSISQFRYNTFAHVTKFTLDDVFSINTSGDGTSSVAETKHVFSPPKTGTPILSPAITTKTGKS
ncbi:hypothetical protein Tco_0915447 [Tanacetum coccineum]